MSGPAGLGEVSRAVLAAFADRHLREARVPEVTDELQRHPASLLAQGVERRQAHSLRQRPRV